MTKKKRSQILPCFKISPQASIPEQLWDIRVRDWDKFYLIKVGVCNCTSARSLQISILTVFFFNQCLNMYIIHFNTKRSFIWLKKVCMIFVFSCILEFIVVTAQIRSGKKHRGEMVDWICMNQVWIFLHQNEGIISPLETFLDRNSIVIT